MAKIPFYERRLKALLFKACYDEYLQDIQTGMLRLHQAMNDVEQSSKLRGILQVVLAMGNYMNGQRGGAYGFKLSSLQKVAPSNHEASANKTLLVG